MHTRCTCDIVFKKYSLLFFYNMLNFEQSNYKCLVEIFFIKTIQFHLKMKIDPALLKLTAVEIEFCLYGVFVCWRVIKGWSYFQILVSVCCLVVGSPLSGACQNDFSNWTVFTLLHLWKYLFKMSEFTRWV